jgi:phosphatidate cytidylyltransferase
MKKVMKVRVISAIVALLICIPVIIYGSIPFYVGVSVVGLIGFMELLNLRSKRREIPYVVKIFAVISFVVLMMRNWDVFGTTYLMDYDVISAIMFLMIVPIVFFNKSKKYTIDDALFMLGGIMFLGIGFNQLASVRTFELYNFLYLILITIITDTFALFVGMLIGKHKMSPTVSPKKTWEGFVGGLVFATFVGTVFYNTVFDYSGSIVVLISVTAILSVIGQVGDLVFSAIKRNYDVKDFGNIMPEHGGILDRLDSILFVVLAFSYIIRFI